MKLMMRSTLLLAIALFFTGCFGGGKSVVPVPTDYTVTGAVTDKDGKGILGVALEFGAAGAAITGAEGRWEKTGLKGNVTITPAHNDYTFEPKSQSVSKATTGVDFVAMKKEPIMPAELRVGQNEPYKTIGEAFAAAKSNDTIIVTPGEYEENVNVNKAVTLVSEAVADGALVDASVRARTIIRGTVLVSASSGKPYVAGFTVVVPADHTGINVARSQATVTHNVVEGGTFGVRIVASNVTVEANIIKNNAIGVLLQDAQSDEVIIVGNTVSGSRQVGIQANSQTINMLNISDNDVKNNPGIGVDVTVKAASKLHIAGNVIHENRGGLRINGSGAEQIVVTDNNFDYNLGSANGGGVYIGPNVGDVLLLNNEFYGNETAASGSGGAVFVDNVGNGSRVIDGNGDTIEIGPGDGVKDSGNNGYSYNVPDNLKYSSPL